ncbi:uncharacterized protein LOC143212566 [Lasioglossum baleicum]|uniref:uncharacterized protein LOC143212566 n=1 Tax=Lasioglossum baleicum TaxID=434251 RepID=UPI003FCE4834
MLKNAKLSRMICIVSSILTYLMLFAFLSLQIWNNAQSASEVDLGGLLHPATFPYDTKKSPNFEITWLGQFIGTVLMAISFSCFDTFLAVLVLHLCGQLSILRAAIEHIAETSSQGEKFSERLGNIVFRHNQLSRFAVIVEDCFNRTLLMQILICTSMLCFTGYRLMSSVDKEEEDLPIVGMVFFIIHVIFTTLHLFIDCYLGETLIGVSTGVAQSAYDCIWYNLPPKHSVSLIMLICRSRISFRITAGKFSPFSLERFNAVNHSNKITNNLVTIVEVFIYMFYIQLTNKIVFVTVIVKNDEGILNFQFLFFVLFISFVIVHMFVYCYVGEVLRVQRSQIQIIVLTRLLKSTSSRFRIRTLCCREPTWPSSPTKRDGMYNVAPPEARCLLFVMLRSTRPLCLTAGKFGTFSMEMFSTILRTAMGYLSVLVTVSTVDN